jgi:hypothetical protein
MLLTLRLVGTLGWSLQELAAYDCRKASMLQNLS